jgi:hypothetical protein
MTTEYELDKFKYECINEMLATLQQFVKEIDNEPVLLNKEKLKLMIKEKITKQTEIIKNIKTMDKLQFQYNILFFLERYIIYETVQFELAESQFYKKLQGTSTPKSWKTIFHSFFHQLIEKQKIEKTKFLEQEILKKQQEENNKYNVNNTNAYLQYVQQANVQKNEFFMQERQYREQMFENILQVCRSKDNISSFYKNIFLKVLHKLVQFHPNELDDLKNEKVLNHPNEEVEQDQDDYILELKNNNLNLKIDEVLKKLFDMNKTRISLLIKLMKEIKEDFVTFYTNEKKEIENQHNDYRKQLQVLPLFKKSENVLYEEQKKVRNLVLDDIKNKYSLQMNENDLHLLLVNDSFVLLDSLFVLKDTNVNFQEIGNHLFVNTKIKLRDLSSVDSNTIERINQFNAKYSHFEKEKGNFFMTITSIDRKLRAALEKLHEENRQKKSIPEINLPKRKQYVVESKRRSDGTRNYPYPNGNSGNGVGSRIFSIIWSFFKGLGF